MKFILNKLLQLTSVAAALVLMTGCMTNLKETGMSQLETPTLETQANRVVVAMGIVRINNVIATQMPLSGDAKWPAELAEEMTKQQEKAVHDWLDDDPYFATKEHTDDIQKKTLGGYYNAKISPLTYEAMRKLIILYGDDETKSPDLFDFQLDLSNFLAFNGDHIQLKTIEAVNTDSYRTLGDAVHALLPESFKDELESKKQTMQDAQDDIISLEKAETEIKEKLAGSAAAKAKDYKGTAVLLPEPELVSLRQELADLEIQVKEKAAIYDEKKDIYFAALDNGRKALEKNIDLTDSQIALAKNVKLTSGVIKDGAIQAGLLYGIALTNLVAKPIVQNFATELQTLTIATAYVPANKRDLLAARYKRLMDNGLMLVPSIGLGSYYAILQNNLAGKYEDIAKVIVEAAEAKEKAMMAEKTKQQIAAQ